MSQFGMEEEEGEDESDDDSEGWHCRST
jgi:hypothetical protein